jgi:hypothetical protein
MGFLWDFIFGEKYEFNQARLFFLSLREAKLRGNIHGIPSYRQAGFHLPQADKSMTENSHLSQSLRSIFCFHRAWRTPSE